MTDIFDANISCKKCDVPMERDVVSRNGLDLRAVSCSKCGDKIVHPADMQKFEQFNDLRGKIFSVKLRVVGNSHAISIPKEIVTFINDSHHRMRKDMDDMVKLCFEDFGRLSVDFGDDNFRRRRFHR